MKPKRTKVATGVSIDCITPYVSVVSYPDGSKKWVYDCITEEDLRNHEDEQRWYCNQIKRTLG